jgi:hypothetical protein
MMNEHDVIDGEEDATEGIVEVTSYGASFPVGKPFLPWHRPRKQFVRDRQWSQQISRLLHDYPPVDNILRYLGLPGVDLLDLRYFNSFVCQPKAVSLCFLGFNNAARPSTSAGIELNISIDEVMKSAGVDPRSLVIRDDFASVANVNSLASKSARSLGPYDVINLDLCDGFGAKSPEKGGSNYYDAVNSLLSLQSRSKRPWLFLLTTRADTPNIDSDVLKKMVGSYLNNLNQCQLFSDVSKSHHFIEDEVQLRKAIGTSIGVLSVFLTGITDWLLGLAMSQQPPTKVEVVSVIGYKVDDQSDREDLISLAFRFTPTFAPVVDDMGLAKQQHVNIDRCELLAKAAKKVSVRVDADKLLEDDAILHQSMVDATASLLAQARYDDLAYKDWVANGYPPGV